MFMRNCLAGGLALCAVMLSAQAAEMNYIMELDQAQLQRKVERLFPVAHEDPLYSVALNEPEVVLREGADRIGLRLKVAAAVMQQLNVTGATRVEGRLRFAARTGEFFLDDATVEELSIDGVPDQYLGELRRLAEQVAREALNQHPVYVLGTLGESKKLMGSEIKAIAVRDGKLVIELDMP